MKRLYIQKTKETKASNKCINISLYIKGFYFSKNKYLYSDVFTFHTYLTILIFQSLILLVFINV